MQIGQTIGYQIRLESRVSPRTQLIFCTNGVLLRSMMGGEGNVLGSLTHVIVDEVNCKGLTDELLHHCTRYIVMNAAFS